MPASSFRRHRRRHRTHTLLHTDILEETFFTRCRLRLVVSKDDLDVSFDMFRRHRRRHRTHTLLHADILEETFFTRRRLRLFFSRDADTDKDISFATQFAACKESLQKCLRLVKSFSRDVYVYSETHIASLQKYNPISSQRKTFLKGRSLRLAKSFSRDVCVY